jgi:hypothetical protein
MLDPLLSSSFGSRAACELARASSVAWLVTNLSKPNRAESSYKQAKSAHEFLACRVEVTLRGQPENILVSVSEIKKQQ